jgi:oligopeptidase B
MGYRWYREGKLDRKPNSFRDFIACAEYLVQEGYTRPGRIAIKGSSAGGMLMGAVANLRPDLWGCVVAEVPFVDVLNTMLDASLPLTPIEWPEWGNPLEDRHAFETIRAYSPYDNVRPQPYPPILVTAAISDPRVTYWEPAKYVARLRATKTDGNPLLLRVNMGAGHFGKSGRYDALHELAEQYAFVFACLGVAAAGDPAVERSAASG